MDDATLIQQIREDPALFTRIYDRHFDTIFNYCYRRTGDFASARDISSETFLKAYLGIGRFRWRGVPVRSWLYRIATNEINLFYRARKYRPEYLAGFDLSRLPGADTTTLEKEQAKAAEEMQRHQQFLAVQDALRKLPVRYQEVLSLRYFEKLKVREIAGILDKPEGTVKSLLSRGLDHLRLAVGRNQNPLNAL